MAEHSEKVFFVSYIQLEINILFSLDGGTFGRLTRIKRLKRMCGKNMLDVCCDLAPYETTPWLELKPDLENVTRSGTGSITHGTNATPE